MAFLPPVIAELGADTTGFKAKMMEARAEMAHNAEAINVHAVGISST